MTDKKKSIFAHVREAIWARESEPEKTDSTPVEIAVEAPLSLREEMQRFVRQELSRQALENTNVPSFEEEDDFDLDDEVDNFDTIFTVIHMPDEVEGSYSDLDAKQVPEEQIPLEGAQNGSQEPSGDTPEVDKAAAQQ